MINLEKHKIFVESLNMDVVPISIAYRALEEVAEANTADYEKEVDVAIKQLQETLNNLNLDD